MDCFSRSIAQAQCFVDSRQRYRLDRLLAQGGMGDVYLATDMLLGKLVALKLLRVALVKTRETCEHFEREVSLCAALRSEHIVQVSDYGVTVEGYPFYVMEYLNGRTLGDLLRKEQRLSAQRAITIANQICAGLRVAHQGIVLHQQGAVAQQVIIVHCDLKPDNIFLIPTTLGELVKILDFGIAKVLAGQSEHLETTTKPFLGTFRYAAPEQLAGSGELDRRADIYSLGILLYEMLSGSDVFGLGEQAGSTSATLWFRAHRFMEPIPLRSQLGCEQLPSALEDIVSKCLQKSPQDRFASVSELSQALQQVSDDLAREAKLSLAEPKLDALELADDPTPTKLEIVALMPLGSPLPPPVHPQTGALPTNCGMGQQAQRLTDTHPHLELHAKVRQALNHSLSQLIGPIAPLVLEEALATSTTELQLIDDLVTHVPVTARFQAREKLQQLFQQPDSDDKQLRPPTQRLAQHQSQLTMQSVRSSALLLPEETYQHLKTLLAAEIGPIASTLLQRALEQATNWQDFVQHLAQPIPDSKRSGFCKQVISLLPRKMEAQILDRVPGPNPVSKLPLPSSSST